MRGMAEAFICSLCDKTEDRCNCDEFCVICQEEHDVRLTKDGTHHCRKCRGVCDLEAQY